MQVKEPGPGSMHLKYFPYAENFSVRNTDAYERLLLDVVRGILGLLLSRVKVEPAWKWVEDSLTNWMQTDQAIETTQPEGKDR